ncbi:hypothetical protein GX50_04795 [[Emmonsia] crescens]|uniref:Uncharacterized protein n=1 Tax=[Emmonsia] crescens TaxID=73230 RepID=A0A2B7ZGG5_9EURO|nr:hypothetical protein GX50_04795 [Emmonsia crescens]
MSDDGDGYGCDGGYDDSGPYDDGGDYYYDAHYDDAGESVDNSSYKGDSPSSSEGDGSQLDKEYPQEELESNSDEATCSNYGSSDGSLHEEPESSNNARSSSPSDGPYRSSSWGEYSYESSGENREVRSMVASRSRLVI